MASRGAQWSRALHRSASCATRDWVRAQALSQPAANGRSVGRRTIGLASSGLGRDWSVWDLLVSSRTSDSCGGPGAVRASQGGQVHGVSSDTLVWLASGLDARCVKKQYGWLGCVSEDA